MDFVDSHCHVITKKILTQIDTLKETWKEIGLKAIVNVSETLHESEKALELFKEDKIVSIGVGKHPWKVRNVNIDEQRQFDNLIAKPNVKVIGEVGLDYYAIKIPERYEYQREWFKFFIEMANKYKKPLNVHVTGAENDILELLIEHWDKSAHTNIHWYSGSEETLKGLIDLDCYFSINPAIHYSSAHQRALSIIPSDKILSESDGDVFYKPLNRMGEPSIIPLVINKIAEIRKMSEEEVTNNIILNFNDYIGK